jgi:hypothetical protein
MESRAHRVQGPALHLLAADGPKPGRPARPGNRADLQDQPRALRGDGEGMDEEVCPVAGTTPSRFGSTSCHGSRGARADPCLLCPALLRPVACPALCSPCLFPVPLSRVLCRACVYQLRNVVCGSVKPNPRPLPPSSPGTVSSIASCARQAEPRPAVRRDTSSGARGARNRCPLPTPASPPPGATAGRAL